VPDYVITDAVVAGGDDSAAERHHEGSAVMMVFDNRPAERLDLIHGLALLAGGDEVDADVVASVFEPVPETTLTHAGVIGGFFDLGIAS